MLLTPHTLLHNSTTTLTTNFRLSTYIVIEYLAQANPTTYLCLSRYHYDRQVPRLYRHVTINNALVASCQPNRERMLHALSFTESIGFAGVSSVESLCRLANFGDHDKAFSKVKRIEFTVQMFRADSTLYSLNTTGSLSAILSDNFEECMFRINRVPKKKFRFPHRAPVNILSDEPSVVMFVFSLPYRYCAA
ncbi:hypothetical protein J007_01033 [Cryptococcus neoformans]|nr:hypothetical protein J007_01033 [Cryptococcus neoformans var. grubii]OXC64262.1 hypothetical protein C358_01030 [Cryptococcus neoformans var. grubii MW-RSA852]